MQRTNRFILWVLLAALVGLAYGPWASGIKRALRDVVLPLEEVLASVRMRFAGGARRDTLLRENRRLRQELERLQLELALLRNMELRYARLRDQLNFRPLVPMDLIACEVVGRDVSGWWRSVRLNKGFMDGVAADCAVTTGEGVVGRTQHVTDRSSEALLLCDPSCRVAVRLPRTQGFGVLKGRGLSPSGRPLCRMELLDRTRPPMTNDAVMTSGLGGVFAQGLLVGYVERVLDDGSGATLSADVAPAVDLARLDVVFVVAPDADPLAHMEAVAP